MPTQQVGFGKYRVGQKPTLPTLQTLFAAPLRSQAFPSQTFSTNLEFPRKPVTIRSIVKIR